MDQMYSRGILSDPIDLNGTRTRKSYPKVAAVLGLDVTHIATSMIGSVIECTPAAVVLRDDSGRDHRFRNTPGSFLVDGANVELVTARTQAAVGTRLTASGSISGDQAPARVARASRLLVEGIHDAELIEKVWGDDLRDEGIVVQPLHGVDDLVEVVRGFAPRSGRRLGILVDHLVANSKETRIASAVNHPDVLVRGHVFVDVWAAIDPHLVGLERWPDVPRDQVWKDGICAAVGVDDPRLFWKQLIGNVSSYRDLDPSLVGAVEGLIDFVTEAS